jgi:hypothetical protein
MVGVHGGVSAGVQDAGNVAPHINAPVVERRDLKHVCDEDELADDEQEAFRAAPVQAEYTHANPAI